ncbi:hypothetical protein AGABI1DRAFT_125357 [Agaricus bisporus var. burnettii JB137-S8]|uniref:Uncharacterized protein n=1 Tax=Agaricus bisporus var. burnettii (strain JB137-S8 / ATCC MYA-4627 / FGSC 10392) TaxID=597362 RepID=K5X4V4_AGABU|nr:uncharacterized protein AGABI1DRAFT_125357 [Agaricus bisporus var. burnettii JB137-S8]EKM82891.1 hypothetical protein AGABI1DRAFT_125357 [Agaricus bisporus var. burnettii JB137-S8]
MPLTRSAKKNTAPMPSDDAASRSLDVSNRHSKTMKAHKGSSGIPKGASVEEPAVLLQEEDLITSTLAWKEHASSKAKARSKKVKKTYAVSKDPTSITTSAEPSVLEEQGREVASVELSAPLKTKQVSKKASATRKKASTTRESTAVEEGFTTPLEESLEAGQMSPATTLDKSTASKEPSAASKEPSAASKKPSAASKKPSAASKESSAASKKSSSISKKPSTTSTKPSTVSKEAKASSATGKKGTVMPKKLPALDDFDHSTEATESTPTPKQSTTALKKSKAAPAMISGKEVPIMASKKSKATLQKPSTKKKQAPTATPTQSAPPVEPAASAPTPKTTSASAGSSNASTNETSGISKAILEEMERLKATIATQAAMLDKQQKTQAARPPDTEESFPLIPRPRPPYNLREAMGLKDNKELYNACRVVIGDALSDCLVLRHLKWREQDQTLVCKAKKYAKEKMPQLRRYERDWALDEIMSSINKNKRSYKSKLARKYTPPTRPASDDAIESRVLNGGETDRGQLENEGGSDDASNDGNGGDSQEEGSGDGEEETRVTEKRKLGAEESSQEEGDSDDAIEIFDDDDMQVVTDVERETDVEMEEMEGGLDEERLKKNGRDQLKRKLVDGENVDGGRKGKQKVPKRISNELLSR